MVDDAPAMRRIATFTLESVGAYEVETADSAEAALELLGDGDFDVLVTDLAMEPLDGIGLAEAVRAMPAFERLPIVLMASEDDPEVVAAATEAGIDVVVSKPLDPEDIRRAIDTVLARSGTEKPTASGYLLLGIQAVLDSMPYPAMLLDADHEVMLGNKAFFDVTEARYGDCGLRCAEVMHAKGAPEDCPLDEAAKTGLRVERIVPETVAGPVHVSVYPTSIANGEGKRLFLHLTRPASDAALSAPN